MILLLKTLFVGAYGYLSRMCGGAPPKLPLGLDQWLFAIPVVLVLYSLLAPLGLPFLTISLLIAAGYFGAFLGKRTGHGGGMDLAHSPKEPNAGREPEKLEYLMLWLHGKIDQRLYDLILVTLTGVAVTFVSAVICFCYGLIIPGIILLIAGAAKGLAYEIGWRLFDVEAGAGRVNGHTMLRYPQHLDHPTAIGEFLTGIFLGLGLVTLF